ncbi:MAG: hypothetical protein U1C53_02325, partial [Candidatus Veblenbacteria bacterium]|nr:hypothetical protein [Candidatus Veblenbacteria bacterium]
KIEELEKQQVKLLQQIEAKKTVMEAQGRSKSEILQAQAKNKIEVDGLNNLIAGLRHPDLISSEETEQQASVNKLKQDAATLEAEANRPYITDLDRAPLQSKLAELKEAEYQENKLAGDYAPATDYEIRREQRSEINKEMSSMETDNWQELHKIMKDAIEVGDTTRAAAAYLKATKYGNENEIQNEFGYASDAVGMRQFIENIFIKKLGMAREQALSIASDASYIGEGVKHWGVARAVNVKNGQLEWQGEDDRNREVLAEVRKVDFEGFLRQANRLAWGREVPGLHDLPPDATPEQREEYYARHGTRDFEINTFGKSYFLENWEKFARGLEQKRFNVNLAVKLSSGKNMEELDRLATEEGFVSPEKLDFFHEILDKITEFASTADGEFADINEILELEKQGKT